MMLGCCCKLRPAGQRGGAPRAACTLCWPQVKACNLWLIHVATCFTQHFIAVCTAGDLITNGKPAPDIFLFAADKFDPKPDPSSCLVFEDAPNGVAAGKAAGM